MLDEMAMFGGDQSAGGGGGGGLEGGLLPGEDSVSQNVLVERIFGDKKFVPYRFTALVQIDLRLLPYAN